MQNRFWNYELSGEIVIDTTQPAFSSQLLNVLLIEMGRDEWTQDLPGEIKKLPNVGRLLSVGEPSKLVSPYFDGHHNVAQASAFDTSHRINSSNYAIDRDLYLETRHFEGAALKMMDRLPDFQEWMKSDLSDRRRRLFREVAFWSEYLELNDITAVIFPVIPHQVYDFIIYGLCKSRNIHTLIFDSTNAVIKEVVGISESIEGIGDPSFGLSIRKMFPLGSEMRVPQNVIEDFWSARPAMLSDIDSNALSIRRTIGRALKLAHSYPTFVNLIQRNRLPTSNKCLETIGLRVRRRSALRRTRIELSRIQTIINLPENFVFFPLHVQPELAVSPLGGHFEEQVEAVRLAARYLPSGWKIVVKEHPDQSVFLHRPSGFYEHFTQISQVDFVRPDYSVDELIENCKAVITISGSIGRQALIAGRPVGLLGSTWWSSAPGVFKVSTSKMMQKMMAELAVWNPPSREEIDQFTRLLQMSIFTAVLYGKPDGLSEERSDEVKKTTLLNIRMIIGSWLSSKH